MLRNVLKISVLGLVFLIEGCSRAPILVGRNHGTLKETYDRHQCSITNHGDPIRSRVSIVQPLGRLLGHTAFISDVVYHERDGQHYLVSASWDSTVRYWSLENQQEIWQTKFNVKQIQNVKLTPDGKFIIAAGNSNKIQLIALQSGQIIREFLLPEGVWGHSIDILPTGESFYVGASDAAVHVFEMASGREVGLLQGLDWPIQTVVYSKARDFVMASSGNAIGVWNASTGKLINKLVDREVSDGETFWVESMAFSPRLDYIIAGSQRMIVIIDTVTGEIVQRFIGHLRSIRSITMSEDYCRVISASQDGSIRIWDVKTGQEIDAMVQLDFQVPTAVASAPDGKTFFAATTHLLNFKSDIEILKFKEEQ